MKIKLLSIATLLLLIAISTHICAQKTQMKFGKINIENLEAKQCPIDSNAHAYFIFDYGNAYFEYAETRLSSSDFEGSRKGFQLFFTRHFRIKILDNQGFSWGNVEIPLYHDGEEEEVKKIKAYTYNLVDGKIIESKLSRKDINKETTSMNWNVLNIS